MNYQKQVDEEYGRYQYNNSYIPNVSYENQFTYDQQPKQYEANSKQYVNNYPSGYNDHNPYKPYKEPNFSSDIQIEKFQHVQHLEYKNPIASNYGFPNVSATEQANQESKNEQEQEPRPMLKRGVSISEPNIRSAFIRKIYCVLIFQTLLIVAITFLFYSVQDLADWTNTNIWIILIPLGVYIVALLSFGFLTDQIRHTYFIHFIFVTQTISWAFLLGITGCIVHYAILFFWGAVIFGGVNFGMGIYILLIKGSINMNYMGMIPIILATLIIFLIGIALNLLNFWFNLLFMICAILYGVLLIDNTRLILDNHKFQYEANEYVFAAANMMNDIMARIASEFKTKRR